MIKTQYVDHLLSILCYDAIIQALSIADRYWLHREIIANSTNMADAAKVNVASAPVFQLSNHIRKLNWQRPELRYNSDRALEVYDTEKCQWKPFKPQDYV